MESEIRQGRPIPNRSNLPLLLLNAVFAQNMPQKVCAATKKIALLRLQAQFAVLHARQDSSQENFMIHDCAKGTHSDVVDVRDGRAISPSRHRIAVSIHRFVLEDVRGSKRLQERLAETLQVR